jgi:putative tricarboxylic transport membrane protein
MPIVFVLCVLGSYSITQRLFDVWVMLVSGIVCYLLRRRGFPVAPFVLGLVLGDIVDKSLRRGLVLSDGSLAPFFTRPISGALAVIVLVMLLVQIPAVRRLFGRRRTSSLEAT